VRCLTYRREHEATSWKYIDEQGLQQELPIQGVLASNNGEVLRLAAMGGMGVALLSEPAVRASLQDGSLVRLLPGYRFAVRQFSNGVFAVFRRSRHAAAEGAGLCGLPGRSAAGRSARLSRTGSLSTGRQTAAQAGRVPAAHCSSNSPPSSGRSAHQMGAARDRGDVCRAPGPAAEAQAGRVGRGQIHQAVQLAVGRKARELAGAHQTVQRKPGGVHRGAVGA
jgi:hypothetical protein